MVSRTRETFEARPRLVPPPGATASASLPGYRRAGAGAGRWDPLPPTAPPRHALSGPPIRRPLALNPLDCDDAAEGAERGERGGEEDVGGLVAEDRDEDEGEQGEVAASVGRPED